MSTAEGKALDELRQIQEFLQSQQGLIGGDAVQQQAVVWQQRLSSLNLSAAAGRQFADLVRVGPWTSAQQQQLATAVNSSVLRASAGASQGHRRQLQEALDFIKYFSKKDLEVLCDNQVSTHHHKLDQIVTRLVRLKLHLPSEPTTRHILAVAMDAGLQRPTATDGLYHLHKELKRMLKSAVKCAPKSADDEHLVKYPSNPADLPPTLLARAYDQGDSYGSLATTSLDLAASAASIPLRACNRSLKGTQVATSTQIATSASSSPAGTTPAGSPMEQCAMMMMNFMMQMCNQGNQQHVASLTTFKPSAPKRRAIGDGSPDEQSTPPKQEHEQSTSPKQEQLALPDKPHVEAASVKAAVPEASTPPKAGEDQLQLPSPKALTFPEITPESQIAKYNAAVKSRQEVKQEVKKAAEAAEAEKADSEQPDQEKPGKAKAKAKAKGEPKANATAKASASKAKSQPGNEEPPCKKAKVAPKEERVIYDLENKPAPMVKGSPTVWYLGGKIHCNGNDYRVFLRSCDRNDHKVRVGPSPDESWQKCLKLIEEAHAEDQKNVD